MKSEYEAMPLVALREVARNRGFKGITALRKQELIDFLVQSDEKLPVSPKNDVPKKDIDASKSKNSLVGIERSEEKLSVKETADESIRSEHQNKIDNKVDTILKGNNINVKEHDVIYKKDERTTDNSGVKSDARIVEKPELRAERKPEVRVERKLDAKYDKRLDAKVEARVEKRVEKRVEIRPEVQSDTSMETSQARKANYMPTDMEQLDSGETKEGILEVLPDGYGFIRCDNFLPGENDVYVSPAQIRRFNLKTGDIVGGNTRIRNQNEKFSALLYVKSVNGFPPSEAQKRKKFEDLTPIFPNERIHLEVPGTSVAMRMVDLISPIGKGQRGMIVSQPKTGKTTLLKQIAKAITKKYPEMHLIILLIDERPEEVTDIKESIQGNNVEVIYSTFDELPENHKRVSEMVIERAKRLVEHKKDVVILLDSITRLARAYNLTVQASGRTLSGGLDPAALHMPKKFFGSARNMREGGSLTILATALVDTGSRMDDVVFEEFKGTGNMELVLDRSLSEKRIFPAIDLQKSSTRRDDLLLSQAEMEANYLIRKALNGIKSDEALERIIDMFIKTKSNDELVEMIKKTKIVL